MEARWLPLLSQPAWYLTVIPEIQAFLELLDLESDEDRAECKQELYDFFEIHLSRGDFALGSGAGQFDHERLPIDTVVIHHTSNPPGLSPIRLSAIELMRLYGPYFARPPESEKRLNAKAIFSGHERNGEQVFWPYHWLIRNDGDVVRLLNDSEIGWHAGNWNVNCRSVGIAFDDDLEFRYPSRLALNAAAQLIVRQYAHVPAEHVLGHSEVNNRTTCPSTLFLPTTDTEIGWKHGVIDAIERYRNLQ